MSHTPPWRLVAALALAVLAGLCVAALAAPRPAPPRPLLDPRAGPGRVEAFEGSGPHGGGGPGLTYGLPSALPPKFKLPSAPAEPDPDEDPPLRQAVPGAPAPPPGPPSGPRHPEPHLRYWDARAPHGAMGFSVEKNADRGLAVGVPYTVTLEAAKEPGEYAFSSVMRELVDVDETAPLTFVAGKPPPRFRVTFKPAAAGKAPGECLAVSRASDGRVLPVAFAADLADHLALTERRAGIGTGGAVAASVTPGGLLTLSSSNDPSPPASLLAGSLALVPTQEGVGGAAEGGAFLPGASADAMRPSFRGAPVAFELGRGPLADGSVVYSWRYAGTGQPSWPSSSPGEPGGRTDAVRDLPVPRSFAPVSGNPVWEAVMQLSDAEGPLLRVSYGHSGTDGGVPGYHLVPSGGNARCATVSGPADAARACSPLACARACDAADQCAGFAYDDKPGACLAACPEKGPCRLLGAEALASPGRPADGCAQKLYAKDASPAGFGPPESVNARGRLGAASGAPESCPAACGDKPVALCSAVSRAPHPAHAACLHYPPWSSDTSRTFEVYRKSPSPHAGGGGPPPAPPEGYVLSPPEARAGTLPHALAEGARSKEECAAECRKAPWCAAFSWARPDGEAGSAGARACMLIQDEKDPVFDREADFCGEYEPLFKYVPIPFPRGRQPEATFEPGRAVDDPADTTCAGEHCPHPCEMDCLRACDTDDGCYGFVVAPADPADPAAGLYCRMIRSEGARPDAPTAEAGRDGAMSYRKVLDGSHYDPLKDGAACDGFCPGAKVGKVCLADLVPPSLNLGGLSASLVAAAGLEAQGQEARDTEFKQVKSLRGQTPNVGTIEYDAASENQCAAKCYENPECVLFTWNTYTQTSAVTGRTAGCRLLNAEQYDRAVFNKPPAGNSVYNYERKKWRAVETTQAD